MAATLLYPVAEPPAPGQAVRLRGGVHWVRLPLPGAIRHINVWLLEDGDGWTLVDTGMDLPQVRAAWDGPLADYLGDRPITRILCTHHHPDHTGLAAWLAGRYRVPVWMSEPEARLLKGFVAPDDDAERTRWRIAAFAREGLLESPELRGALAGTNFRGVVSGMPAEVRALGDGDVLEIGVERWVAHRLGGHTDAQLVFHLPAHGLLISGDQVLPRITSNIGIYPERADRDPIRSFVASFDRLAALDPEPTVLPSHGDVFVGLRARINDLRTHHAATLERVIGFTEQPTSARELADRLFRTPLDSMNLVLAVGEALANLEHLALCGRLRTLESPDAVRRYQRVA